jgi:hypothetical protein
MFFQSIALVALLAPNTYAQTSVGSNLFLRFGCSQLVVERIDPLVNPGVNPSPHTHQIVGGNSFNASVYLYSISLGEMWTDQKLDGPLYN